LTNDPGFGKTNPRDISKIISLISMMHRSEMRNEMSSFLRQGGNGIAFHVPAFAPGEPRDNAAQAPGRKTRKKYFPFAP
jgi:hypothetical protein